jgi:hypothetical protein
VLHSRSVRLWAATAVAASALAATVNFAGPAASAAVTIKCSAFVADTVQTNADLGGCNGNTGGSGTFPFSAFSAGGSGTITWANGKMTSIGSITTSAERPGEMEKPPPGGPCPADSTETEVKGKVTSDTTGSAAVGGVVKAELCMDFRESFHLEPGTKAKFL